MSLSTVRGSQVLMFETLSLNFLSIDGRYDSFVSFYYQCDNLIQHRRDLERSICIINIPNLLMIKLCIASMTVIIARKTSHQYNIMM